MMKINLFQIFYVTACAMIVTANDIIIAEEEQKNIIVQRPVGRAYSVSTCDYKTQIGYTCLSCHRALHCYPGNAAILVDCYGIFRYCRDGRCSRFQGEKCLVDTKISTESPVINEHLDTETADVTTRIAQEAPPEAATPSIEPKVNDVARLESESESSISDNVV